MINYNHEFHLKFPFSITHRCFDYMRESINLVNNLKTEKVTLIQGQYNSLNYYSNNIINYLTIVR